MTREFKETLTPARAQIAKLILGSVQGAYLKPHHRKVIEEAALGEPCRSSFSLLSMEFFRAGASFDLTVRMEHEGWPTDDGYRIDPEGNKWSRCKLNAEVNWPAIGARTSGMAWAFAAALADFARLAAEIDATVGNETFETMARTAAQVKEDEAKRAAARLDSDINNVLAVTRQGLRPGKVKNVDLNLVKDIPDGTYERTYKDKKYIVTVKTHEGEGTRMALLTQASE